VGLGWIHTDRFDAYRKRDIAKAEKLLDEAGFPRRADGKRFALRVSWDSGKDTELRAAASCAVISWMSASTYACSRSTAQPTLTARSSNGL